jgi:cellulose synthase/poly-beta-1,6-N-acetylglucosamine synthase-like glycosyltransferase
VNGIIALTLKKVTSQAPVLSNLKSISIIIALKNEEEKIETLLASLNELDYPAENFEVIFIDDNSINGTYDNISEKIKGFDNFNVYQLQSENKFGKRNALELGISKSLHPHILITDADCEPEKDWLKAYSNKFTEGFDFLFGIAPFFQEKSLVNKISCFENLRNSMLSIFAATIGLPYSAAARNFGFKKTSFEEVGGYSKTIDTLSGDDDLLLREAFKKNLKIGTVITKGSFVFSKTKKTLKDYLKQRARHTQTSFHYLFKQQLLLGLWHLFNLLIVFSPILFFLGIYFLLLLPVKLFIDLPIVLFNQGKFSYKFSFIEVLYLQIFYELFLIIHFFNAKFGKIEWK